MLCLGVLLITLAEIRNGTLLDFEIYYMAGSALLNGETPYQFYGEFSLPFQYFPWVGWLFVPLAAMPIQSAWIVYAVINMGLLYISVVILLSLPSAEKERAAILKSLYIFSASLLMSLLVFIVGQISIFLLFVCVLIIKLLHHDRRELAGLIAPFLLTKPHLMLLFLPYTLLKGGKRFILYSAIGTAVLAGIAAIQNPAWGTEMFNIIRLGQDRGDGLLWGFSTLPGALELRNWRIMNFLFAVPSLAVSICIIRQLKRLPLQQQLSFSLALSLFSAPYSFAYDLPLIIPALIYLSGANRNYTVIMWLCAAFLPRIVQFQGQTYFLILATVILICFNSKDADNKVDGKNGIKS